MAVDGMTLAEFLLARIGEDQAVAQAARDDVLAFSYVPPYAKLGFAPGDLARRYDPARVLADCEAHRRIVSKAAVWLDGAEPDGTYSEATARACYTEVVQAMATVYADHADYRPEWAP